MNTPSLTLVERLTLANQYRILAALSTDKAPAFTGNAEILLGGHSGLYAHVFDEISEEVPPNVTTELQDILDMFRGINVAFTESLKSEIEAAGLNRGPFSFNGFSHEYKQYSDQALVMVEHLNMYQELKGEPLISDHWSDMMRYRRMLMIYQPALKSKEGLTIKVLKGMHDVADALHEELAKRIK